MKRFLCLITLLCTGCLCLCLTACQNKTKNQAEWGFRWGNEFTLFTRAAQTAPEEATSEITSQPLLDYLAKPKDAAPAATPAGTSHP